MKPVDHLRKGALTFEQALPLLERADAGARELAAELARRAEGAQVPTLLAAAAAVDARDRNAIQRFTVARELLARGRSEHVFDQPWPLSQLIALGPHAVEHLGVEALRTYFATVSPRLADVAAGREPADTLQVLGIKPFAEHLDTPTRDAVLAWLAPRVEAEAQAGEYEELDYAYGQVDPAVELARCFAVAGRAADAVRLLEARAQWSPSMMHDDELIDLAVLCNALPDALRGEWRERLREWAVAADRAHAGREGKSLEAEWMKRTATSQP